MCRRFFFRNSGLNASILFLIVYAFICVFFFIDMTNVRSRSSYILRGFRVAAQGPKVNNIVKLAVSRHNAKEVSTKGGGGRCVAWKQAHGGRVTQLAPSRNCSTSSIYFSNQAHLLHYHVSMQAYRPVMGPRELCLLLQALQALHNVLTSAAIPYFMSSGILLGSWRHHGIIPWDGDADIMIHAERSEDVVCILRSLGPRFDLKQAEYILKFFVKNKGTKPETEMPFTRVWPFVDIVFYHENATHLWWGQTYANDRCLPKAWVFPPVTRPFHDLLLTAPRRTGLWLERTMTPALCVVGDTERRQVEKRRISPRLRQVRCEKLRNVYPFVKRRPFTGTVVGEGLHVVADDKGIVQGRCKEVLVFNGEELSSFVGDYIC